MLARRSLLTCEPNTRQELNVRLRLAAILALFLGATLALGISPAGAAEGDPITTVSGRLVNASDNQAPVPGVTINVTAGDGTTQSAVTDSDGRYRLDVPAVGETTIAIDTSTFPEGVSMGEGSPSKLKVTLDSGRPVFTPIFSVGQGEANTNTWVDRVPQIVYQGLYFGLIMALGSLGLSMIYGTTGLSNFAHGELVTFGAIVAYTFNVTLNMNIWISAVIAVVLSAAFGLLQDTLFWRKLRKRGTGLIALMIVSIGLQFLLRNIFQFFTGGRTLNYNEYATPAGIALGPITYSNRDLVLMGVAILLLAIAIVGLQRTRIGRATRAIADNPALSASTGINVDRVITVVWTVGTLLAGTCGVLLGFSQSVKFDLGAQILLVMFAAITVGGLGSIWGAVIGSLLVGVLIEASTLVIPSELKIASAMFLLIAILLIRPQGIFGRKERVG